VNWSSRQCEEIAAGELRGRVGAHLALGHRLALVAGHDDGDELRAVYLFTSGPPDERHELVVHLNREHPTVPTSASNPLAIRSCGHWCATSIGPSSGIRCAVARAQCPLR